MYWSMKNQERKGYIHKKNCKKGCSDQCKKNTNKMTCTG